MTNGALYVIICSTEREVGRIYVLNHECKRKRGGVKGVNTAMTYSHEKEIRTKGYSESNKDTTRIYDFIKSNKKREPI